MKEERWLPVVGFEGLYEVSSLGRVKSLGNNRFKKEVIMNLHPNKKSGYLYVPLYKNKKKYNKKVHRLVAIAFIPNPLNLPHINHKDENKQNNCVDNLEWCTHKYNVNYGTRNKKISEKNKNRLDCSKPVVCIETGIIYPSISEASRKNNIKISTMSKCCLKRPHCKTAGGYHWQYFIE